MRYLVLFALGALMGCDTPGLAFRDVRAQRVVVQGSVFDVRVLQNRAEAIRINTQYAPRIGPIGARAGLAMEAASGCRVVKLTGDAAVVTGRLDCGTGTPRPIQPKYLELDCIVEDQWVNAGLNQETTILDCDPVV